MSRPLSLLLAAAMAVTPLALGTSAASAQSNRSGEHHSRGWDDDGWRWGHNRRHHRGHYYGSPGFSFSFGVPFANTYSYYRPYHRDCYRGWDGALYCRAY